MGGKARRKSSAMKIPGRRQRYSPDFLENLLRLADAFNPLPAALLSGTAVNLHVCLLDKGQETSSGVKFHRSLPKGIKCLAQIVYRHRTLFVVLIALSVNTLHRG